jgi:antitoxin MazE
LISNGTQARKRSSIETNVEADISVSNGKIVLDSVLDEDESLESLVAGITEDNIHSEVDTGNPIGKECL